ncbi:hypothetical protein CONLIGDRAFT_712778 [Coniochaeta ligniaria NRRL 30616]|uniref:ARM repeat-containing protein n=1 Tax=Coniochaeta ligniaria NRRL 30616 TaxID=1408157 RepID=A0A1J7IZ60_9PEZI|nr:hypothetical protein CONLIGDRAFT_712778 [Coniochaeta ligniaria NRRL 30616]
MAALENLRRQASQLGASLSTEECCTKLSEDVPSAFSFAELLGLAGTVKPEHDTRSTLVAIAACLQHIDRLQTDADDTSTARELASWIARSIAPTNNSGKAQDEDSGFPSGYRGTTEDDPYDKVTKRCLSVAEPGLTALTQLWSHSSKTQDDTLDSDSLATLIALSDTSESWTTPTTAVLASNLLQQQLATLDPTTFLVETILKGYLQTLFSKSRPPTVTASGRKAAFPDDDLARKQGLPDDSARTKPWKYADLRSLSVLAWAIAQADQNLQWPLYIPPLLTLLDDPQTRIRSRGLCLTTSFLSILPAPTLRATGLASVFEDAIFPSLSYLPSLTPEAESVALLDPAFDALLVLAGKLGAGEEEGGKREERRLLDKVLREGVLAGYFHCPEYPRIVEVLMQRAGDVLAALGLGGVKHLKDLVPVLKSVITDPFAYGRLETVVAGVRALQAVVGNCWPRLVEGVWAEEVLGVVVVGWVRLLDLDEERRGRDDVRGIREELRKTAMMMAAVARSGGVDFAEKVGPLVAREPALAELFGLSGAEVAQLSESR